MFDFVGHWVELPSVPSKGAWRRRVDVYGVIVYLYDSVFLPFA